eukprot:5851961-Pleurochrysis_carterae.AAC.9
MKAPTTRKREQTLIRMPCAQAHADLRALALLSARTKCMPAGERTRAPAYSRPHARTRTHAPANALKRKRTPLGARMHRSGRRHAAYATPRVQIFSKPRSFLPKLPAAHLAVSCALTQAIAQSSCASRRSEWALYAFAGACVCERACVRARCVCV